MSRFDILWTAPAFCARTQCDFKFDKARVFPRFIESLPFPFYKTLPIWLRWSDTAFGGVRSTATNSLPTAVIQDAFIVEAAPPFNSNPDLEQGRHWICVAFPKQYFDHLRAQIEQRGIRFTPRLRYARGEMTIDGQDFVCCQIYLNGGKVSAVNFFGDNILQEILNSGDGERNVLGLVMLRGGKVRIALELEVSLKWAGNAPLPEHEYVYELSFEARSIDIEPQPQNNTSVTTLKP
ncbi:hypothetical protein OC835_005119 [Tilletia horrida]|nr:hypothetical protein OC835_005119 [Tilletia horrida]